MIEKMFMGPETFIVGNDSIKRFNVHCENKFVLAKEIQVTENFKSALAVLNVRWQSFDDRCHSFVQISSVGQLQAETMGRPGLLGLWILVKK